MPKISDLLPPPAPINGEEKIPVVQDGDTWGLPLGEFLEDTVTAATAKSEAWAESDTAPGGAGTKSAKTWAGEAAASATAFSTLFQQFTSPIWLQAIRDAAGKFVGGIRKSGEWDIPYLISGLLKAGKIDVGGNTVEVIESTAGFANLMIDGNLIGYIKPDGTVFISHLETMSSQGGTGEVGAGTAQRILQLERDTSGDAVLTRFNAPFTISKRWDDEPKLIVSFVDDDGIDNYVDSSPSRPFNGGYFTWLRPVLRRFNMPMTEGAIAYRASSQSTGNVHYRWRLMRAMQDIYGHEIANHSSSHVRPADGVSDGYDHYNVEFEWVRSYKVLKALGFDINTAVYPFGLDTPEIREAVRRNHVCAADTPTAPEYNISPLKTYQLHRYSLDALGGFGSDFRLPHEERRLANWIAHIEAMKALVAAGQRVWVIFMLHAYKSEWTNWDTTGLTGTAPRATLPTNWGAGEAGYNPNWVICGLRDGGGNLIYPTSEITAVEADNSIPAGWRPQLNTRLHDLWQFTEYLNTEQIEVKTLHGGWQAMKNIVDVGDYTSAGDRPHYVVGRDGTASFNPLILE